MKAGFVAVCAYMMKKSISHHILNAHRATLVASMMMLKQEKNAPN
jgi:hypothetical protein